MKINYKRISKFLNKHITLFEIFFYQFENYKLKIIICVKF